jgi:hypothetical protein
MFSFFFASCAAGSEAGPALARVLPPAIAVASVSDISDSVKV